MISVTYILFQNESSFFFLIMKGVIAHCIYLKGIHTEIKSENHL